MTPSTTATEYVDTLIIGGGAMGLATAWHLAKRGKEVTLLERLSIGNAMGASHGTTRNFNQAYYHPKYVAMLVEARRLWAELEGASGSKLLDIIGMVNHGFNPQFDEMRPALAAAGIPTEMLPPEEAHRRWPGIRFDTRVLYAPESGRVRADAALQALQTVATACGADIRQNVKATNIEVLGDDKVRVTTESGVYEARRLVVTAGAWVTKLLHNVMPLPQLVVTQVQPAHFGETLVGLDWPGFNHNPTPGDPAYDYWPSTIYGMHSPGEGIKAGWDSAGTVMDPDARTFEADPALHRLLQRYVREWLPGADADNSVAISCTYTTAPNSDFVLKELRPVTVGTGFSGQGFKFTPAVGRILADLVTRS